MQIAAPPSEWEAGMSIDAMPDGKWRATMEHVGMHGERTTVKRYFFTREDAERWEDEVRADGCEPGESRADFFKLYRNRLGKNASERDLWKLDRWEEKCNDYRSGEITWKEFRGWTYLCDISNCENGGWVKPEPAGVVGPDGSPSTRRKRPATPSEKSIQSKILYLLRH